MQNPKTPECPTCGDPMTYTNTLYAKKGTETLKLRIFTCQKDKTFKHTTEPTKNV